jgi:type I restriction enzyme S subunit
MSEWKEYKLGETLVSANTGLDAIKRAPIVSRDTGIKCLRIQDISQSKQYKDWGFTEVLENNFTKFKLLSNDIIVARTGATVGVNMIIQNNLNSVFNNGLIRLRAKNEFNSRYIYYLLRSSDYWNHINSIAFGTTSQPNIQINQLLDFKVKVPTEKHLQASIAEILSSLDDKIELNNKINQELENLAQTLFKQWFIDFEFPNENGEPYKSSGGEMVESELGEIPKGWEIKRLKQILNIKRGGSPRPIHDYMASSGLPWVKISDATALNNPFLFSTKEFIKVEGLRKTILLKKGSLILSNSATPGLPIFLELDACIHDGWLHFQDIERVTYNFLYLLFLYIRVDLVGQGNGSIFINLKTDILKEYAISIPDSGVLEKFSEVINPIFETIKNNASENIKLTNLRDTLLPKLISGELEINEITN